MVLNVSCEDHKGIKMSTVASNAVAVFTSWGKEDIIKRGASGNWGVSADRILQNRYLVVTRNRHSDWCPDDYEHGTAFLIGRISGVAETEDITKDGRPRYAIEFDAYAEVEIPHIWGKSRNPVWFTDLDALGINLEDLSFVNVEGIEPITVSKAQNIPDDGISFAEARRGLAARYSVSPSAVEIIIRG